MRINELNIENFRGFRECTIRFPDSNLAVFAGINGAGKTAVLDCIAMLLNPFSQKLCKKSSREIAFSLSEDDININTRYSSNTIKAMYNDERLSWRINRAASDNAGGMKSDYKEINKFLHTLHGKVDDDPDLDLPLLIYYQTERGMQEDAVKGLKLNQKKYTANQFYAYENNFRKGGNDFNDFLTWFRLEEDPQVLSNVEKENVFILEDDDVVKATPYTKGRDSNSILYELQGVEERPGKNKKRLGEAYRFLLGACLGNKGGAKHMQHCDTKKGMHWSSVSATRTGDVRC